MVHQLVSEVKSRARDTARAAALSALGALFAIVGLAFLTGALWLLFACLETPLFAATVIGALYCGVGLTLLAFGMRGKSGTARRPTSHADLASHEAEARHREPFLQMAEGFAMGLQAGRSARAGR